MTDKIIDEVMGLISDWSEKDFLWGSAQIDAQLEMATSADFFNEKRYGEEAKSAKEAIRAKLREVLERKPLSDAQIEKLREQTFSTSNPYCPCDSKTMRKAVQAAERAHNIGAE